MSVFQRDISDEPQRISSLSFLKITTGSLTNEGDQAPSLPEVLSSCFLFFWLDPLISRVLFVKSSLTSKGRTVHAQVAPIVKKYQWCEI